MTRKIQFPKEWTLDTGMVQSLEVEGARKSVTSGGKWGKQLDEKTAFFETNMYTPENKRIWNLKITYVQRKKSSFKNSIRIFQGVCVE